MSREHHVYTDGSAKAGEGGPGGWGFVVKPPSGPPVEGYGSATGTLAKTMEYRAVAEALATLPHRAHAIVYADNLPLVENLQKKLAGWTQSGFVNVDPQIVASVRRVAELVAERALVLRFQWVRGQTAMPGTSAPTRWPRRARARHATRRRDSDPEVRPPCAVAARESGR